MVLNIAEHGNYSSGADPGIFLGGGALFSCSTSTPINHIVWQNTSCIRKPQVISGGGEGAHPLHPPPRSAPVPPSSKCLTHSANQHGLARMLSRGVSVVTRSHPRFFSFSQETKSNLLEVIHYTNQNQHLATAQLYIFLNRYKFTSGFIRI